jgi:hypothetical protein
MWAQLSSFFSFYFLLSPLLGRRQMWERWPAANQGRRQRSGAGAAAGGAGATAGKLAGRSWAAAPAREEALAGIVPAPPVAAP